MKICPVRAEFFHADGQTDRHDEVFRNLANAPNNEYLATVILLQISNHCWACALITKDGHSGRLCTWTDGDDLDAEWWCCLLHGQNFSYIGEYTLKVSSMIMRALRSTPTHIVAHPQTTHSK